MKKLLFVLLFFPLVSCSGEDDESIGECIDDSQINESIFCPAIYMPVCGCNGITYSNDCIAESKGVISFSEGECN